MTLLKPVDLLAPYLPLMPTHPQSPPGRKKLTRKEKKENAATASSLSNVEDDAKTAEYVQRVLTKFDVSEKNFARGSRYGKKRDVPHSEFDAS